MPVVRATEIPCRRVTRQGIDVVPVSGSPRGRLGGSYQRAVSGLSALFPTSPRTGVASLNRHHDLPPPQLPRRRMQYLSNDLLLSATDLSHFLGCRHRTALEMDAAAKVLKRPHFDDPLMELLFLRGLAHERAYVDELRDAGRTILDLSEIEGRTNQVDATLAAMRAGTDVIAQGALRHGEWFGKPDLLLRTPAPSALGAWS